jgi:cobalt-zinc-cadmium efflux system outer membrane protein
MQRPKSLLTFLLVAVAALATRPAALAADAPSGTLTLARALALTLEQSPELAAYSWDIRAAEARIIQARLRPNPEISITEEDLTGTREFKDGTSAERTLQLSQLVELGGKRPARVAEAQFGRVLSEFDYQVRRVEVLRETTEAFIDALVAQRRLVLAEETLKLFESAVPLTQKRVEVGKASTVEVVRSNVSVALAQIGREQARRDLLAAKARLSAQWGETKTVRFEAVSGDLGRMEPVPEFSELVARLGRNPQIARWTAEREKREATLRLQQAQAVPDITAFVGPRVLGNADNVSTGVLGFSMPLPFFNRNQGNIAEARALLSKTDPEERAAEAKAFGELSVAYQTLLRASEEVLILKDSVLPGATQSVELLTAGYEAGRFSQLEILDARRTLTAAREQHLRALADHHKALAQVEALTAAPVELHHHLESGKPAKPGAPAPRKPAFRK